MSSLPSSHDKLQQLCEVLQGQALEPARLEAQKIVEEARLEAARLLEEAKFHSDNMLQKARDEVSREKEVAEASLKQAAQQAVARLRQEIESHLVSEEILKMTRQALSDSSTVSNVLKKYLDMLREKGWDKDLTVEISSTSEFKELAHSIIAQCAGRLKEGCVLPVLSEGGLRIRLHDRKVILDASESAVTELLSQFLRKELRTRLFA